MKNESPKSSTINSNDQYSMFVCYESIGRYERLRGLLYKYIRDLRSLKNFVEKASNM